MYISSMQNFKPVYIKIFLKMCGNGQQAADAVGIVRLQTKAERLFLWKWLNLLISLNTTTSSK